MTKLLKYSFVLIVFFSSSSLSKENFFDEAKMLYEEGKLGESKFLFQRNIVFNPKDSNSYLYLAKIYEAEENDKEKEKIITGETIEPGDVVLGLPSSGLHTNGYSFARKLFFEIGGYDVNDTIPELEKSVGLTLLEPHINYTNHVFTALDAGIDVKGIAHITGGGLVENIPRILPDGCGLDIKKGSWPILPVFDVMQSLGDVEEDEMFRAFNMGIGMVFIVSPSDVDSVKDVLKDQAGVFEIGAVVSGNNRVVIK